jgi:arginyl-tRNA--protein-N-Asp/Glu arginylyltransferase
MQVVELVELSDEKLDNYLSMGWFRMNQTIFTTNIEWLNNAVRLVIWLRVRLHDFDKDDKYKDLFKKNRGFRTEITPALIHDEHEQLFTLYKQSKVFDASDSIRSLLFHEKFTNAYNTWMINVYDDNILIGAGYFDIGKESAAGITSFYHPDYHKHSLGLFIIYEKMFYCKNKGVKYFYPGYYAPDYPAFDYKLKIGKRALEFYHPGLLNWFPFY